MGAGMTLAKRRLALNEPHMETAQSDGILTLDTDMRAPLKALRVGFEPVQEGEGDPSPENVRPITGRMSVNIEARGKNLFDKNNYNYIKAYFLPNGKVISNNAHTLVYLPCKPNTTYTASRIRTVSNERFSLAWTNENEVKIGTATYGGKMAANSGTVGDKVWLTVTTGSDATYLLVWAWWSSSVNAAESLQIELGSTATAYEPYQGSTVSISWADEAGTVYGGYLEWLRDGSVRLTKTHESVNLSSLTWQRRSTNPYRFSASLPSGKHYTNAVDVSQHKCSIFPTAYTSGINSTKEGYLGIYRLPTQTGADNTIYLRFADTVTTLTELNAFLAETNPQYCYPLANPVTYTLTPQEVLRTLRGENNLWSDANGAISATYWTH